MRHVRFDSEEVSAFYDLNNLMGFFYAVCYMCQSIYRKPETPGAQTSDIFWWNSAWWWPHWTRRIKQGLLPPATATIHTQSETGWKI